MPMLEIKDIRKAFHGLQVLDGVDLSVEKGDVIAILGPSGSGKTTLLRCLNFLETADSGEMIFDGERFQLGHVSHRDIARLRKKTAFVFQNYNLFLNKTALQNVTEGLIVARKTPKDKANQIARKALEKVGLLDRCDQCNCGNDDNISIDIDDMGGMEIMFLLSDQDFETIDQPMPDQFQIVEDNREP